MGGDLTVDELISTLNHSNSPTLILEGKDDYIAFEHFERENVEWGLTVLPVKGRDKILQILNRREELENECIFFIMDQDEWCLTGVPHYLIDDQIAFTFGASIENDLISDGNPMSLMTPEELDKFWGLIADFASIFRRLVYNHENAVADYSYGTSMRIFCDEELTKLPEWDAFAARCPNMVPQPIDKETIDYIRGKTLLEIVTMILSHKNRVSKYSKANVLEIGARRRGERLVSLEANVIEYFAASGCMGQVAD